MYDVIEYELYKKKRKYVEKLGQLGRLDKTIYNIRQENYGGSFSDHPLQKTSKAKSGLDKLRECHVTGEILLIYIFQTLKLMVNLLKLRETTYLRKC